MDVGANIKNMPFPWYDDVTKQNYQKAWCYNDVQSFRLITPYYKLPPFQIKRAAIGLSNEVTSWKMINIVTGEEIDLLGIMQSGALDYRSTGSIEYIIYNGLSFTQVFTNDGGLWYCEISDGTNIWYSEVVMIICFADPNDTGDVVGISDLEGLLVQGPSDFLLAEWDDFILP